MRLPRYTLALLSALTASIALADEPQPTATNTRAWMDANVHINQLQIIGTHNSYHQEIPRPVLMKLMGYDPALASEIDYASYTSLTQQLDMGLRQIEIDVYNDPQGGRYAHPLGEAWLKAADPAHLPFDPAGAMNKPGFKVLHFPDVDYLSSCMTYRRCLLEVRAWSRAHPGHLPIFIHGNAKDPPAKPFPWGGTMPLAFDEAAFRALDAEILSVFDRSELITPADVQGTASSLLAGARAGGWPTLGQARGKILFLLDGSRKQARRYQASHQQSAEGLFFVDMHDPMDAGAGYTVVMDPRTTPAPTPGLVASGFMVRTLADFLTIEPRSGDASRRDSALASGAQIVSTDYVTPDKRFPFPYMVKPFDTGSWFRCNPVNAPTRCRSELLEEPEVAKAAVPSASSR